MQLAHATATLANNGVSIQPHFVTQMQDAVTGKITPMPLIAKDKVVISPENLDIVKNGMIAVTQPGGTAARVGAQAGYTIAAKTGTAQVIGIKQNAKYNASSIDERHRDHALFVAYAPADDPKIALAVIVENGGHGGSAAGPIARKVMDYYLLGKTPDNEQPLTNNTKPQAPANVSAAVSATEIAPEEELND
jgi:penicillin-binding protein 2